MSALDEATMQTVKEEMLPFLSPSARPDVKHKALGFILGLTGKKEGVQFVKDNPVFLEAIVSLTSDDMQDIIKDAFRSLLNLATDEDISWHLLNLAKFPNISLDLMKYLLRKESDFADLVGSMLANMTRTQRCALKLAAVVEEHRDDVGVEKMVDALCNLDYNQSATLDCLGLLLSNLTQISSIRQELMDKNSRILQRLIPFTEYKGSHLRRGGVVGTLKNCCFETDRHDWLMGDQVDILPRLLLPLAGPEEFDEDDMDRLPDDLQYLPPEKEREKDPDIRKMLVEAVTQLCSTRKWRLYIKEKNTYVIMRELHKWETDRVNNVAIMSLIDILIGDEPKEGMEDLHTVDIDKDLHKELDVALEEKLKEATDESVSQS
ncbi:protein HGH1 homolog [Haliotis cracherodii]|uniref:protein HGH1 homolog n=1 Tax=Haliotis cracherodii TaxID=6455 RepID=UPI0039E9FE05